MFEGLVHWMNDSSVKIPDRIFFTVEQMKELELEGSSTREEVKKILFDADSWGLNVTSKSTTILKTVLFKCSLIPGSSKSVDLHEILAYQVLKKDSNEIFQTETVSAIIAYKWKILYPCFLLQFALRVGYVVTLLATTSQIGLEIWTVFHLLLILLQITFSKKSFVVWIYFIWPVINLMEVTAAIMFIYDKRMERQMHDHLGGSVFWLVLFCAMMVILPWLRIFTSFRFYLTVLLKAFMRTFNGFILLMLCIAIWQQVIYFQNKDGSTFWMSRNEAFKVSYEFAWGEDLSGWLDMLGKGSSLVQTIIQLCWLLFAYVVMNNIMIAIGSDVYDTTKNEWQQGDV